MTRQTHRLILASLLAAFSLLNLGVSISMLGVIPFHEFETDIIGRIFSVLIYVMVVLCAALYSVQLLAAVMFWRGTGSARTWGLVGSVIAIIGGTSLPVGVYGLWLLASRSKWEVGEG